MKTEKLKILAAVYVVGVVVTFGHAWKNGYATSNQYQRDNGLYQISAVVGAAAWPFYWSYIAWR